MGNAHMAKFAPKHADLSSASNANAPSNKISVNDAPAELRSSGSDISSGVNKWNLGLMNSDGKYLTAENFGFKINATGNTLRKKQKWSIEQDSDEFVYLLSPLGCFLSADKYGKVSCEKTASDSDCKFLLESNSDGKWAFKSASYGYYFGGSGDRLHCFSKTPELWTVHLAIHPQVWLVILIRNLARLLFFQVPQKMLLRLI